MQSPCYILAMIYPKEYMEVTPKSGSGSGVVEVTPGMKGKYNGYGIHNVALCSDDYICSSRPIPSYSQPQKIEKRTSELSCHEESTKDEDFLA